MMLANTKRKGMIRQSIDSSSIHTHVPTQPNLYSFYLMRQNFQHVPIEEICTFTTTWNPTANFDTINVHKKAIGTQNNKNKKCRFKLRL